MLSIEIISDFVCPWCYIGTRRLAVAIDLIRQEQPDFECRTIWRPFFLNPDTPPEGEPYLPFLEKKFGSRTAVEAIFARVRAAGEPYGLTYAFEKIALRANTLQAHRLIHWAQTRGDATALVERLFQAQFQRGEYVGAPAVLASIATECGYDAAALRDYLAIRQDEDLVKQSANEVRHMGITMVPTFILPSGEIIVGAEDPAILAAGIRRALP